MIFRVSVAGSGSRDGPAPIDGFGTQLELRSIVGLAPSASMAITYNDSAGTFGDGTPFSLHVPTYLITNPYRALPGGVLLSPRVAPPNFGLGLLEAIPEATIVALATSPAAAAAGVSGRANYVRDAVGRASPWGASGSRPTSPRCTSRPGRPPVATWESPPHLFATEHCDDAIPGCGAHPPEMSDATLQALAIYIATLGVPARRSIDQPAVARGEQLFASSGCTGCHVATLHTGTVADAPELSNQKIHPYTDLLVHDMGPGLADGRPDYLASGSEWRTPPLWGIGLTALVNGHTNFLHDGRARSLEEAILWHGGQAATARETFRTLPAVDRAALLTFLNSL